MNKADRIIGCLVILLGLTVIWLTQYMPPAARPGIPGPAVVPRFVAVALVICGLILFMRAVIIKKAVPIKFNRNALQRLAGVMGVASIAVVILSYLGFIISCSITSFLFLVILGVRARKATLTAVIITASIYLAFYYGLQVQLPPGSIW